MVLSSGDERYDFELRGRVRLGLELLEPTAEMITLRNVRGHSSPPGRKASSVPQACLGVNPTNALWALVMEDAERGSEPRPARCPWRNLHTLK
jgi:hypothetical protein